MKLITRTCKCGCGGKWRTLASSRWWYWNQFHAAKMGAVKLEFNVNKMPYAKNEFNDEDGFSKE